MQPVRCLGLLLALSMPAGAQAISLDDLQGVTVHTTNNYVGRFRNAKGEAPGGFTTTFAIKIGPGAAISTKMTRNTFADTPRGRVTGSMTRTGKGEIGKPREANSPGSVLWVLEDNTLVSLRVFEVGASIMRNKLEKSDSGLSCSVSAPIAREVGAGATTDTSAMKGGGKVEVLSAKQISSSCRVSRD